MFCLSSFTFLKILFIYLFILLSQTLENNLNTFLVSQGSFSLMSIFFIFAHILKFVFIYQFLWIIFFWYLLISGSKQFVTAKEQSLCSFNLGLVISLSEGHNTHYGCLGHKFVVYGESSVFCNVVTAGVPPAPCHLHPNSLWQ